MARKDYSPYKPVEMFNDLVTSDWQLEIAKGWARKYYEAHQFCYENFNAVVARDHVANYRRACIEDMMPDLFGRFGGFKVVARKNVAKNCSHYLACGEAIMLTESLVDSRETLPRSAEFRKGYAKSRQMMLFQDGEELNDSADDGERVLYGIITHMPVDYRKPEPAFIDIIFPDRNYEIIMGRLALLEKFPDVVDLYRAEATEIEQAATVVTKLQRHEAKRAKVQGRLA